MRESLIDTGFEIDFEIWRGDRCLRGKAGSQTMGRFSSVCRSGVIGGQEGIGYEIWRSMKISEGGRGQGRKLAFMDTGRRETGLQGKTGSGRAVEEWDEARTGVTEDSRSGDRG